MTEETDVAARVSRAVAYFCYRYFLRLGFLNGRPSWRWHFWQGLWYRLLVDREIYRPKRTTSHEPRITNHEYDIIRVMKWSKLMIQTLREDPGDAEIDSHKLMVRAGLMKKAAGGHVVIVG